MVERVSEWNVDNLIATLHRQHDEVSTRTKKIKAGFLAIQTFLSTPTPVWKEEPKYEIKDDKTKIQIKEGIKSTVLYQYDPDRQLDFNRPMLDLEMEFANILNVSVNLQKQLYLLTKDEPQKQQTIMTEGQAGQPTNIIIQPKMGVLDKIKNAWGKDDQSLNVLQSPYLSSINQIEETKAIFKYMRKFVDYHSLGILRSNRLPMQAMRTYLRTEIHYFSAYVQPEGMKLIGEAIRISLDQETTKISDVLSKALAATQKEQQQPQR